MYCTPGPDSSNLIKTEKAVPISPENNAKIKYNVPISLALEDKNHLSSHKDIDAFWVFILPSMLFILELKVTLQMNQHRKMDYVIFTYFITILSLFNVRYV
jgi:hypothetical protein